MRHVRPFRGFGPHEFIEREERGRERERERERYEWWLGFWGKVLAGLRAAAVDKTLGQVKVHEDLRYLSRSLSLSLSPTFSLTPTPTPTLSLSLSLCVGMFFLCIVYIYIYIYVCVCIYKLTYMYVHRCIYMVTWEPKIYMVTWYDIMRTSHRMKTYKIDKSSNICINIYTDEQMS